MAACLPPLSGSKDTDHHTPERLLQVQCVTNRSRQPPTLKLENDNPRDGRCLLRSPVKMERFPFYCTSEGVVIASALRVGDCVAEDMSCSCQSAGQTLYLCDLRSCSIRLLLPSAGLLAAQLNLAALGINDTAIACKWRNRNILTKSTIQRFFIILSV